GRCDEAREGHRVWRRGVTLHQGHETRHARLRAARVRHDRAQPRARLRPGRVRRRHEAVGHRPRRRARGADGVPGDAIHFGDVVERDLSDQISNRSILGMPKPKVLHLTLEREWFDQIAKGIKRNEYREYKPYWKRRLEGRTFDLVRFRNGYTADAPEMLVEYRGLRRDGKRYVIQLGRVLKTKRWRSRD